MQFTNIEEIGGEASGIHSICLNCLLNCMVSSVDFPHPNSDFYEDLGEGREKYRDCLTKINQSH